MNAETVLSEWHTRSGEYSPRYYAYYGPNETSEFIRERLEAALDRDAAIMELGCSSGRHLAHLHESGFENLYGIDINETAFEVMEEAYPQLAADGTFYCDAIEEVVPGFDDGRFDAVYSVESLQHIHRDNEWVFEDVARITDSILVTAEIERERDGEGERSADPPITYVTDGVPLYYRDWSAVFTAFGFVEAESSQVGRDTVRVFRRTGP